MIYKLHNLRHFSYSSNLLSLPSPQVIVSRNTAFVPQTFQLLASGNFSLALLIPSSLQLIHFYPAFQSQLKCLASPPSFKCLCILLLWHLVIQFIAHIITMLKNYRDYKPHDREYLFYLYPNVYFIVGAQ